MRIGLDRGSVHKLRLPSGITINFEIAEKSNISTQPFMDNPYVAGSNFVGHGDQYFG
jgi:hypothetical protein